MLVDKTDALYSPAVSGGSKLTKGGVYCFGYQTGKDYELIHCLTPQNYDLGESFSDTVFQIQSLSSGFFVKIQKKHIYFMRMPEEVILLPFWKIKSNSAYSSATEFSIFNSFNNALSAFLLAASHQDVLYKSDAEKDFLSRAFLNFADLEIVDLDVVGHVS